MKTKWCFTFEVLLKALHCMCMPEQKYEQIFRLTFAFVRMVFK